LLTPVFSENDIDYDNNHLMEDEDEKNKQHTDLEKIITERLNINYDQRTVLELNTYFLAIEYVKLQPADFKSSYMKAFTEACTRAYNGPDTMTCTNGALERILLSFDEPIAEANSKTSRTEDYDYENYEKIKNIINLDDMITESIKDWYKLHNKTTGVPFTSSKTSSKTSPKEEGKLSNEEKEKRKTDLKNYLLSKFPDQEAKIDEKIKTIADSIGYEDENFTYGGRKKRTTKKIIKKRISKKSKNGRSKRKR
jgi:hypothetical protein